MVITKKETILHFEGSVSEALLLQLYSQKAMPATKKSAPKKRSVKKADTKTARKPAKKNAAKKKNKLGVENSLVNNINARKKKGVSRPKSKKTVSKTSYQRMEENWD